MDGKIFDYEKFAKNMATQAKDVIPNDIDESEKAFLVNLVFNYCNLAGEALVNDKEHPFDDEQIETICQLIGEWAFYKAVDIIRANIPLQLREDLLQKIAFTIYEISELALSKGMPIDNVVLLVEEHVKKAFSEEVVKLFKEGKISQKVCENALGQNNIDKMREETENEDVDQEEKILGEQDTNKCSEIKSKEKMPKQVNNNEKEEYIVEINENQMSLGKTFLIAVKEHWMLYLFLVSIGLVCYYQNHIKLSIAICVVTTILTILFMFILKVNEEKLYLLERLEKVKQRNRDLVNPNNFYERLGVDVLCLKVGEGLLTIADPDQGGQLLAKIAALRQRLTNELGYIIPLVRVMDSSELEDNEYSISVRDNVAAKGFVYPGKYMVNADQWNTTGKPVPSDAIKAIDPVHQAHVYWVDKKDIDSKDNIVAVDSCDVIISHLKEICIKYVDEIMTNQDILKLMELVKSQDPTLVNDLVPTIISTSDLRKIFVNLIREKVSIKDIIFIFERLCDYARFSKEPDILSERLRAALGRQICLANSVNEEILYAVSLSAEWEKTLDESCERTELGTMFLLNPVQIQQLIEMTASTLMRVHQTIGKQPVILCPPRIRLPLWQLLERHIPTIVVISYSELITTDIRVEVVDSINVP